MKDRVWHSILICFCLFLLTTGLTLPCSADSGICGDNITWSYEGTTLTISGQGEMLISDQAPWFECRKTCTTVIIEDGITSIGSNAFSYFGELTHVDIPDSVTEIGQGAFQSCSILTELSLSENITRISRYAFRDCGIREVTIPSGVKVIEFGAFFNSSVRSLTIRDGVIEIGSYAFSGCSGLSSVIIPDSVTVVGSSAFFGCGNLKTVTLSKNLTEIAGNVFSQCSALESIEIPDSVDKIGINAFNGCKKLSSVTIGAGVKEISTDSFLECRLLKRFNLSSDNPYLTEDKGILYKKDLSMLLLAPQGFAGDYTVLSGTVAIGGWAFFECEGLTKITLPYSVTSIGKYCFDRCKALRHVDFGPNLETINTHAFWGCDKLTVIWLPASLKEVGSEAFAYCDSLKSIHFVGDLPALGNYVFWYVTATVHYPAHNPTWNIIMYPIWCGGSMSWDAVDCGERHIPRVLAAVPASCTKNGLTEGSQCADCGMILTSQRLIPSSHSYGSWITDTNGKAVRTCAVCGTTDERSVESSNDNSGGTHNSPPSGEQVSEETQTPATSESTQETTWETTGEGGTATDSTLAETSSTAPNADSPKKTKSWPIIVLVAVIVVVADGVVGAVYIRKRQKEK